MEEVQSKFLTSFPVSTFPLQFCLENLLTYVWLMQKLASAVHKVEQATAAVGSTEMKLAATFSSPFSPTFFPSLHLPWSNFPFGLVPTVVAHYLIFLSPFILYIFRGFCHLWSSAFGWMNTANGLVGFAVFCRRAKLGDSTLGWFCHPSSPLPYQQTRYSKTFSTLIFATRLSTAF